MGDRVVDCARLESVCAERHRGFESPPIRLPRRGIMRSGWITASRNKVADFKLVCCCSTKLTRLNSPGMMSVWQKIQEAAVTTPAETRPMIELSLTFTR
jgi:hypothetical protein